MKQLIFLKNPTKKNKALIESRVSKEGGGDETG